MIYNYTSYSLLTNMIVIATVGDPHFKKDNIIESQEMVTRLIDKFTEKHPTIIVVLGDVLHRHETINVFPLNGAEDMIMKLSKIAPTFVLVGNHDRPNNSNYLTDEHPFNSLKHWPNTYIVDQVKDVTLAGHRFIFVPYVPPGKFMDALNTKENPLKNTTAIFAHQEFEGAKMGAIISKAGDKWSLENPLVISGHIHDYDHLQENIIYTGTLMQHSFGDRNDKTVSIFTFQQDKSWSQERIDLGLKKRIIVRITPQGLHTWEPPKDVLIKLKVRGDEGAVKASVKLERVRELKKMGIIVVFETIKSQNKDEIKYKSTSQVTYKDRLYSEIENDLYCVKWYRQLINF